MVLKRVKNADEVDLGRLGQKRPDEVRRACISFTHSEELQCNAKQNKTRALIARAFQRCHSYPPQGSPQNVNGENTSDC